MQPSKKRKTDVKGLNVELHPALSSTNANLIKAQQRQVNPYLDARQSIQNDKTHKRYKRGLKFFEKGEISLKAEQERARLIEERNRRAKEEAEREEERRRYEECRREKVALGEEPDEDKNESAYISRNNAPDVEWWDEEFLNKKGNILPKFSATYPDTPDSDYDSDTANGSEEWLKEKKDIDDGPPSIRYIHHPVLVNVERSPTFAKIYLTKAEYKKIRRKNRRMDRSRVQSAIKLGIEPKPETKVKLGNMMNVLDNNQNITDPTAWEKTVREQVDQRKQKHLETNQQRHIAAVEAKKLKEPSAGNSANDRHCRVFYFRSLAHPKIRYKLNMNSKQLGLKGTCLRVGDDGSGIIIVLGTEKSTRFYQKLVLSRIKWNEDVVLPNSTKIDMSGNIVKEVWQGYLSEDFKFRNWFMKACESETQMKQVLLELGAEYFYYVYLQELSN